MTASRLPRLAATASAMWVPYVPAPRPRADPYDGHDAGDGP